MVQFEYILDKIKSHEISNDPFPHLYIENFFDQGHFEIIAGDSQIKLSAVDSTENLIELLQANDYSPEHFPGCTTDIDHYLKWYNSNQRTERFEAGLLEGFGIAFRLRSYRNHLIKDLIGFLNSDRFHATIKDKFNKTGGTRVETAIQKYLSGYEISPHPDIRKKCLTYMININTDHDSEHQDLHTHLLTFKPHRRHIYDYWRDNPRVDRCWVPWSWCDSQWTHTRNNSILMFAPSDSSLHAVKLDYDHLVYQRTQIYGNLWYRKGVARMEKRPDWRHLDGLNANA